MVFEDDRLYVDVELVALVYAVVVGVEDDEFVMVLIVCEKCNMVIIFGN